MVTRTQSSATDIRIDKWVLTTEPGVRCRCCSSGPSRRPARPSQRLSTSGPTGALAAPGGPIEKRVIAGESVAMIDPRGMGETTPGAANSGRSGLLGPDTKEAFLALALSRPLLGQRVYDVLQALRAIEPTEGLKEFHVIGVGAGGPIALHVAALDDRVKLVEIERSLISWSAVARTPASRGQLAGVVPDALESYDLPDLAASLAPRALTIRAALDPSGKPVASETLDDAYARCKAAYKTASAADKLELQAAP